MKNACLVLLMMLSTLGYKSANSDGASLISQSLTRTAAGVKKYEDRSSQITQALADTTTVPPASVSKVPPMKAKNAGAQPCSRQSAVNHDAQVIPSTNRAPRPQSRVPADQQTQCQAQKPLHKPPPN